MSRARSKKLKDLLRKHAFLAKEPELTEAQLNQRDALAWYIRLRAYHDCKKRELINVMTTDDNAYVLGHVFGVSDSAVFPCYAFDGCVLRDSYGQGAFQR